VGHYGYTRRRLRAPGVAATAVHGMGFHQSTSRLNLCHNSTHKTFKPTNVALKKFSRQTEKWTSVSPWFTVGWLASLPVFEPHYQAGGVIAPTHPKSPEMLTPVDPTHLSCCTNSPKITSSAHASSPNSPIVETEHSTDVESPPPPMSYRFECWFSTTLLPGDHGARPGHRMVGTDE